MISNQDGYPDLNGAKVDEEAINAMKTDIYNPLGMAAEAAREGDTTKCALYVENIADVVFPTDSDKSPTEEAAPLRLVLHLDVAPRASQTRQEAIAEMTALVAEYLTEDNKPLFEDYGARASDLEAFREDGESPSWGGYEGPFVTRVSVARADDPSGPHHLVAESDW